MEPVYRPGPDDQPHYWYHKNCGGKTWIQYDDIHIVCKDCGKSGLMLNWRF